MEIILYPFVLLSALGLLLSLAAHIGALLGLDIPPEAMGLHMGIFVVWIPAVIMANSSLTKNAARKDYWKIVLRGAPTWMRYMTFGFFIYAFVNFIVFIALGPASRGGGGDTPPSVIRGFSGHWMAFYSAAFSILYSAIQIKRKGLVRRCPNGHEVSLDAAFCEECGQAVFENPQP